eukprot:CAMPEP_0118722154 /NCGR_PEP_ID=MMETSP0800-20121206/31186_1 /TAXON_ID=210618 ORGANISM="Striatella unipunctata, Strain CCMP2910" /NCGR_SAMPLE_ID=MMETSP0800 /ASSEMBLY_ACC=CAM_ASM_000638 /LENGTH=348 /DNA_ID=CAMNT_0006630229 /DNA_START=48 /DNA_END=1091 /DNA_ORIENTATION=+
MKKSLSTKSFYFLFILYFACICMILADPMESSSFDSLHMSAGIVEDLYSGDGFGASREFKMAKQASPMMALDEMIMEQDDEMMMMMDENDELGMGTSFSEATTTTTIGSDVLLQQLEFTKTNDKDKYKNLGKMLVHNGDISISTRKLDEAAETIESWVTKEGNGYVQSRSSGRGWEKQNTRSITMEVRVEAAYFDVLIENIKTLADDDMHTTTTTTVHTNTHDVTDHYVDAVSRADTIDSTRKALQALLSRANTVQDVLQIQRELTKLTQEYESHMNRAKSLKKDVTLSTLIISLQETRTDTPMNKYTWWNPKPTFYLALQQLGELLAFFGNAFIYCIVFSPFFVVVW